MSESTLPPIGSGGSDNLQAAQTGPQAAQHPSQYPSGGSTTNAAPAGTAARAWDGKSNLWDSKTSQHPPVSLGEDMKGYNKKDKPFSEYVLARPELHPSALYGVLKYMVDAACANTEAVPSTVGINILARFAATLGNTAYIQIGDQRRHLRMNALIVGPTAKGRKGTSADMPDELFRLVDGQLGWAPLRKLTALATGEGLIHQLRDPHIYVIAGREVVDPGVPDKRLLCDVSEFAGVLAQARREGSTISTVLRDAFDGRTLTTPTKTSFNKASNTHICVVGSVPETEIIKSLSSIDITNGLANRFAMFYSVRTKTVPMPEPTDATLMRAFAEHVRAALWEGVARGQIRMDTEAEAYWHWVYDYIENQTYPPAVASLLGRQSTYTLIFAALLALLNREYVVECKHLEAALSWMKYWEQTALFVFSNGDQNEEAHRMRSLENEIIQVITTMGGVGVPHTEVANRVTRKYQRKDVTAGDVKTALERLQRESPPRIRTETLASNGRPSNRYSLVTST